MGAIREVKSIDQMCDEFFKRVKIEDAPAVQRYEMRNAFFAGFAQCLFECAEIAENHSEDVASSILTNYSLQIEDHTNRWLKDFNESSKT
jgi:hypothetical protein